MSLAAITVHNMVFAPNVGQAWADSGDALSRYNAAIKPYQQIGGLENLLTAVGPYKEFQWKAPQYTSPVYNAPAAYQPYNFNVKGLSDEQWGKRKAEARERVSKNFSGTRERVMDEMLRSPTRQSQAAALMAGLGAQETQMQDESGRALDIEQANQAVELERWRQEKEASELASKYNLDTDAARYMVQRDTEESRFKAGMSQWLQEQQAAEKQMAYQSRYGLAQDRAQTRMQEWEANRAANTDYQNALLQGQQAATQRFAQGGTYLTNLTDKERKNATQGGYDSGYKSLSYTPSTQYKMPTSTKSYGYGSYG